MLASVLSPPLLSLQASSNVKALEICYFFKEFDFFFQSFGYYVLIHHSHKKRKDFGGGRSDSASTFFKIASAS